jgi:hypothetical protein
MSFRLGLRTLVATVALVAPAACTGTPSVSEVVSGQGWLVTVYYTAVESFHRASTVPVRGCPKLDCANGEDMLGQYPDSFVTAVRDEGTGRITSGPHRGKYLNWSHDVGYWLDSEPRDSRGRALEPFRSAAADNLPDGTRLRLADCGRLDNGEPVPETVCGPLRAGQWEIRDAFTPGLGGAHHIDLYIGEETGPDFPVTGALYVTLHDAAFAARR